jgi:hypothetical protein
MTTGPLCRGWAPGPHIRCGHLSCWEICNGPLGRVRASITPGIFVYEFVNGASHIDTYEWGG